MENILYRAKRKNWRDFPENEWWVYGLPGYGIDGKITEFEVYRGFADCDTVEIDPETICRYSGHEDKNGKKIFRGDILSAHLDEDYPDNITYVQVVWDGFSWCTREGTTDEPMSEWDCENFEVCGNIFDNPELLEGDDRE